MNLSGILEGLNDSQKKAVTTTDGPVLVVAGPGTGKTLTIVRRIAYMVHQGVAPENILAVTFTNRAAREMKERSAALLGKASFSVFIGTFHLLGLRMLRDARPDDFTILDRDDQAELVRSLIKGSGTKARAVVDKISRVKNMIDEIDDEIRGIYEGYQSALLEKAAFDFDDLILKPVHMLDEGNTLERYRSLFKYIIVDEYQDINPVQYRLLRLLSGEAGNICAVGDPDQAIYAFRGADVTNFLNFGNDYVNAERIDLTEHYRSTCTILDASDGLIRNNVKRLGGELQSVRDMGSAISVISAPDEKAEGEAIIREIESRIGGTSHDQMRQAGNSSDFTDDSYRFSDFAVIYRTNAQARGIEEAFIASGIPYQVVGGRSSLQSKATAETLAYLQSLAGPAVDREIAGNIPAEAALLTTADFFDPSANAVALMTMHMAKGLEFRTVFIAGVEDGLVPFTIKEDGIDIEEERRLFYVGMTRAKDELFLVRSRNRFLYGQRLSPLPSPFLTELPEEFLSIKVVPDRVRKQREDSQMGLF